MGTAEPLLDPRPPRAGFAADVRRGLTEIPKRLPAKHFYDPLGSQLFEAICLLPWYPITRAELLLLELYAGEMVEPLGHIDAVVELGCGSGTKLSLIAKALDGRGPLDVHLIDVSGKAIELSERTLSELSHVTVHPHCTTYEQGLRSLSRSDQSGRKLVLFLGSNIGNFDPEDALALLAAIRRSSRPGDGLLLGADLVRAERELIDAYADPLGVTAAFNKNVLLRINTELGGAFDLDQFCHRAVWNARASRVEMHLVSRRRQRVFVSDLDLEVTFDEGETIWTESSYKYTPQRIVQLGREADFSVERQWVEPDFGFATTLFVVR
jgi:L-histidine Nalpha-methyltransferase